LKEADTDSQKKENYVCTAQYKFTVAILFG